MHCCSHVGLLAWPAEAVCPCCLLAARLNVQVLRVIDSLQLTAQHSVATPVNWQHGDRCMVVPTLSDEQALQKVRFVCHLLRENCMDI